MFDEFAFRDLLRRKGKTLTDVANALHISIPTLYRKMSGESDFYRDEIRRCCEFLEEPYSEIQRIFFAKEVS